MGNGSLAPVTEPELQLTRYARHDPAHCLCPGLFRAMRKQERDRPRLDVKYEYAGAEIRFRGPTALGADDLRVLAAVVALAGRDGTDLTTAPKSEVGRMLRALLGTEGELTVSTPSRYVHTSMRQLAREAGYSDGGGAILSHVRQCLDRLDCTKVQVTRNRVAWSTWLLARVIDLETGDVAIAVNPQLAAGIIGGQHARIDMSELRALSSDAATLIFHRLCGWLDPGSTARVTVPTLADYVWPTPAPNGAAARKRRQRIRAAMAAIGQLAGWTVRGNCDVYAITRPPVD